ncbi:MAG: hypothetical protein NZ554_04535 [Bryobacteraceae bacterium]|nr:hypothetical protein [Bryobacteraceae bacterium]
MLASEGFRLVGRDPHGTIASFMWADERRLGRLRATGDLEKFILPASGNGASIRSARVESAVLETVPKNRGCEVRLRISFGAPRGVLGLKRGWISLASSGKFEQRLLAMLDAAGRSLEPAAGRVPARAAEPLASMAGVAFPKAITVVEHREHTEQTRLLRLDVED